MEVMDDDWQRTGMALTISRQETYLSEYGLPLINWANMYKAHNQNTSSSFGKNRDPGLGPFGDETKIIQSEGQLFKGFLLVISLFHIMVMYLLRNGGWPGWIGLILGSTDKKKSFKKIYAYMMDSGH